MKLKKKLLVMALVVVIIAAMCSAALAASAPQTVNPTASTVYVNGVSKPFEAYNIGGSNFFKLRDLAFVLNGTEKQFEVGYDNDTRAITLTSGQPYTVAGGEMTQGDGKAKTASPTASRIYFDGKELNLTVYNIGGNNFFKLRDLMEVINVYVGYDNDTKAITLDTSKEYELEQQTTQPNPPGLPSTPETTTPPVTQPPEEPTTSPTVPDNLPPLPARTEGWARALQNIPVSDTKLGINVTIQSGDLIPYRYLFNIYTQRRQFEIFIEDAFFSIDSNLFEIIS